MARIMLINAIFLGGILLGVVLLKRRAMADAIARAKLILGDDPTVKAGKVTPQDDTQDDRVSIIASIVTGLCLAGGGFVFELEANMIFGLAIIGASTAGFINLKLRKKGREYTEFDYLKAMPLAMEKLIIAIHAGNDIVSALNVVIKSEESVQNKDPIILCLKDVIDQVNAGARFETALRQASLSIKSKDVAQSFIHIANAHKSGGELLKPLRELADASQSAYQDGIEEQIATMPAKSLLPLTLVFAGAFLALVAQPLTQIIASSDLFSISKIKGGG